MMIHPTLMSQIAAHNADSLRRQAEPRRRPASAVRALVKAAPERSAWHYFDASCSHSACKRTV